MIANVGIDTAENGPFEIGDRKVGVHLKNQVRQVIDETSLNPFGGGNECVPYSAEACRQAAVAAGLELGSAKHAFEGRYGTKGCYAYSSGKWKGHA